MRAGVCAAREQVVFIRDVQVLCVFQGGSLRMLQQAAHQLDVFADSLSGMWKAARICVPSLAAVVSCSFKQLSVLCSVTAER